MSNDPLASILLPVVGVAFMVVMVLGVALMFYDMGRKK